MTEPTLPIETALTVEAALPAEPPPVANSEPVTAPEVVVQPESEPEAVAQPESEPEAVAQRVTPPEVVVQPESEPGVAAEDEAESVAEVNAEPMVEAAPVDGTEAAPEPVARVEAPAATPLGEAALQVDTASLVPLEEIAPAIVGASLSRRAFLGFGLMVAGGMAGAAGLSRLFPVFDDSSDAASPIVSSYDPAGKAWTFVVDTASCIGCGLCVVACKEENHIAEPAEYTRTWVERHVVTADGTLYVDSPEAGMYGFPAESTAPGAAGKTVDASFFEPRLCMQCEDSPCTAVCPVGATYRTEDGVILVDSRRCIGCGYCVVACPYGARYLTPAGGDNPNDMPGVADKCTWCYHRISRGAKPACVEVCPVGARRFGDASDPASEIATLVRERNPQMLHPEYGTRPRVLYLGPAIEEA
jgi:tetrathionate reductase subunit B